MGMAFQNYSLATSSMNEYGANEPGITTSNGALILRGGGEKTLLEVLNPTGTRCEVAPGRPQ